MRTILEQTNIKPEEGNQCFCGSLATWKLRVSTGGGTFPQLVRYRCDEHKEESRDLSQIRIDQLKQQAREFLVRCGLEPWDTESVARSVAVKAAEDLEHLMAESAATIGELTAQRDKGAELVQRAADDRIRLKALLEAYRNKIIELELERDSWRGVTSPPCDRTWIPTSTQLPTDAEGFSVPNSDYNLVNVLHAGYGTPDTVDVHTVRRHPEAYSHWCRLPK